MARFSEFWFDSTTGTHRCYALLCLPEEAEIRGIVQIAHGIGEHIGRYRDVMEYLANHGFAVAGNDHLGHGHTAEENGERAMFVPQDGWDYAVGDLANLHDLLAERYPGVPYIMLGHSMGSFLVRTYLADYPEKYDLAILSGTGHQSGLKLQLGCFVANCIVKLRGYDSDGKLLNKLTMGNYLKRIPDARSSGDWISRDPEQVARFAQDPMRNPISRAGMYRDMLMGIRYVTDPAVMAAMDLEKPVLFFSGSEDPVGEYGKGVRRAYRAFRKAGLSDVTLKLYPGGRHEMLNELNRRQVFEDVLKWIERRL